MQKVYLGRTQGGQYGYFTNGFLAWSLSYEDYVKPTEWHEARCKQLRFEFIADEDRGGYDESDNPSNGWRV